MAILATELLIPADDPDSVERPNDALSETGLCLSGGGYRAMLFHVGSLWRLYESGVLGKVHRISSVSGGAITAAILAQTWDQLMKSDRDVDVFKATIVTPIRKLASKTIDIPAIVKAILFPATTGEYVAAAYRRYLFGDATLQDLPNSPIFVINATNVQSGALWRFTRKYMRDYRVGEVEYPDVLLSVAVAASSAFPPFLSPLELRLHPDRFTKGSGKDLQREPFDRMAVLTDGGVYDNLGLETVWKRCAAVLVSDGGGKMTPSARPARNWLCHSRRVLDLVDNQVRALRKRQLIESYTLPAADEHHREGGYWGIRTDIRKYGLSNALPCPFEKTTALADMPTRLARVAPTLQEKLINWGYAVCDAAVRKHVDPSITAPQDFPYPQSGI
ncbi:patatin-like phospholipase family protein [Rhizobium leguminosarum bv. viciae]|nr:patatin-like phospholipase family protein [Rhizobium leguminosarum bv. viciae]